jgi:hypothetical protein
MDKIKLAVKKVLDNPLYLPKKPKKQKVKKSDIFEVNKSKCTCKNKKK